MRYGVSVRDVVFWVLAAGLVLLYVLVGGGNFALDDSWIHQTFARNLAEYGEWSFIPGQPTAASTSPLYTVLLATGYVLSVSFRLWTHGLGVVALALAAMLAARLAARLMPDSRSTPWLTGLAVLFTWHHIWAATAGMETMLFGTLTLLLIWLAWQTTDEAMPDRAMVSLMGHGALAGIVTALTTLARPEGLLAGGLMALLMLIARPQGNLQRVILWGSGAAMGFALFIAPYLLLNLQLTGAILPDTAAAKFEQHAILLTLPYTDRVFRLLVAILAGGQILLIPGMMVYVLMIWRRTESLNWLLYTLPLLWSIGLILLYAARLPADYQHGRYVIPALPALVTVGTIGTLRLMQWGQMRRGVSSTQAMLRRVGTRSLGLTLLLLYAIFALITGPQIRQTDVAIINQEMVATADWIAATIPPDELLAIHDVGAVGYFAPRPALLDIAGLVSPEIIPIVSDDDALWEWMQAQDARYLMAFPDQIPGGSVDDARLCRVFITDGEAAQRVGGPNMAVYRLAWNGDCFETS